MKKRIIFLVLLIICMFGLWVYLQPDRWNTTNVVSSVNPISAKSIAAPLVKSPSTHVIPYGNEDAVKPPGVSDAEWQRILRVHAAMKSQNNRVYFYGKVLDQNNNPIEDVDVMLEVVRNESSLIKRISGANPTPSESYHVHSDVKGLFCIENIEGQTLAIKSVKKNGYKAYGEIRYFTYGSISTSLNSSDLHRPDPLNPVVVNVWKCGIQEAVSYRENKISSKYSGSELDLKQIINLIPEYSESKVSSILVDVHVKSKNNDRLEVTFRGVDGIEFTSVNDLHHNRAPIDGYSEMITIAGDSNSLSNYFYFRSRKDGYYGFCKLSVENLFRGDSTRLNSINIGVFGLKINPHNSPNLEVNE